MRRTRKEDPFPVNGFEAWGGYMNAKKAKLTEQFNENASKESHLQATSKMFSGVSVYVNGYTVPSADEIKMAMMLHGGQFHQYYSATKTKYIIASNLASAKLKKIKGQPKVVKPQWIAECLASKKLLDFRPFLLYSNQSKQQPKIQFPQLSEFESPVKIAKFKKLQISFGETSTDQKITSTPKVVRHHSTEDSLSSDDLFNLSTISKEKSLTALLESSDSRGSTPSSEIGYHEGGQKSADESDDNFFDCTLVAEELDAVEKKATEAKVEESSIHLDSTTDEVRELLADEEPVHDPLSYSKEETALVINSIVDTTKEPIPNVSKTAQKASMKRAGEANFLEEFYSNSRLHHISTMGSTFKEYVTELRKSHLGVFPGREKMQQWKVDNGKAAARGWTGDKIVMHIDMDCFFVSVGVRSRPELKGLPVAVTHAKGNPPAGSKDGSSKEAEFELYRKRLEQKAGPSHQNSRDLDQRLSWKPNSDRSSMSEIASCNYEARKAGLKNGMFLGQALKLCPNLKMIPYDFEAYKEVSYTLYNTVASLTLDIEAVSCDEMFVDCTQLLSETDTMPLDFASFIRKEIKSITGCPASTGFGSNILQARLATRQAKPDGQYHLLPTEVTTFMENIKIADLPGVGRNLTFKMKSLGLQVCADLQKMSLSSLQANFGQKIGSSLFKHCRGNDDRSLEFEHVRKSVSAEVNYGIRFKSKEECNSFVQELAGEVQKRLEAISKSGRCITLKLMVKAKEAPEETAKFMGHGVCDSISKSTSLLTETSDASVITRETLKMISQMGIDFTLFRGMGVQVSKLVDKKRRAGRLSQFVQKSSKPLMNDQPIRTLPSTSAASSSSKEKLQIDPEVLAELPDDIRQEILREYKSHPVEPVAGPSTSKAVPMRSAAELSMSQVDPTFLDALPEDLRNELVAELRSSKTRQSKEKVLLPGISNSPKKASSPSKKTRGRPKGSKNKPLIMKPLKLQSSPFKVTEQGKEPEKDEVVDVSEDEDDEVLSVNARLEDVLSLIKEWVQSASEPFEIDVEMLLDFLNRLLAVRKIYQVEAVLRCLKLFASRKSNDGWTAVHSRLVASVQPLIEETYGCKLKT